MDHPQLARLIEAMATLRQQCPWDAEQTHESLAQYLIEETAETIEAVETGDSDHLREELGDLLLQVIFHAEIAAEHDGGFTIDDIAAGIADKLIGRHPYVFATKERPPISTSAGRAEGRRKGPDIGPGWHPRPAVVSGSSEQNRQPGALAAGRRRPSQ